MIKKIGLLLIILFTASLSHAQEVKSVYERYLDFNLVRLEGDSGTALEMGEAILDSAGNLPPKARISFYNSLGKLYEDNKAPEKAIPYYEKVAAAVPNYYVVHLALGYIYLEPANDILSQLNGLKKGSQEYTRVQARYKTAALKAVQHLEIAQACDPNNDTLTIIKAIYTNIGDIAAINTLNERLAKLSKNCLDILSDQ